MKYLLDEHIDPVLSSLLEQEGFTVRQMRELDEGVEDEKVVEIAEEENMIIITRDDDFLKLKDEINQMPCIMKVNGFPEPSTLKENILNEINRLETKKLENAVLYV